MDSQPPGSSVHGILQARILEWAAIPFSRGSSWPRDQTQVSRIAGGFFTVWAVESVIWLIASVLLLASTRTSTSTVFHAPGIGGAEHWGTFLDHFYTLMEIRETWSEFGGVISGFFCHFLWLFHQASSVVAFFSSISSEETLVSFSESSSFSNLDSLISPL